MRYLFITLAFFLSPLTACAEPSLTGIYKYSFENGTFGTGDECKGIVDPDKKDGDQCIVPYESENLLGLYENQNGDLDFALSLAFFNGHSCALDGTAKKQIHGWAFEITEIENETCRLHISVEDNTITTTVPEGYNCNLYCGARGTLDGTEFALSSKTTQKVTSKDDLAFITSSEAP